MPLTAEAAPGAPFVLALALVCCNETANTPREGAAGPSSSAAGTSALPAGSANPSEAHARVPGAPATPLDRVQERAAELLLERLAARHARGAVAVGEIVAGQFREREALVRPVSVRPGGCYSVLALGLSPVTRLELAFRSRDVPSFGATAVGDGERGPEAAIGANGRCLTVPGPAAPTAELVLSVETGQGVAVARVYEKR
jgi:hypothetical protein